jgi:glycosyltransferase involved in cell wall biosynthesis
MIIVYLGRRGGGSQLLMSTLLRLENSNCVREVWISASNEDLLYLQKMNYPINTFKITHELSSLKRITSAVNLIFTPLNLVWKTLITDSNTIVHIMPSPLDLVIDLAARIRKKRVVRIIHDFKSHQGENWPTSGAIRIRLWCATHVITFSKFVLNNLPKIKMKISTVANLPSQYIAHGEIGQDVIDCCTIAAENRLPIVLVIGRGQTYKGLDYLGPLSLELENHCSFLVAGRSPKISHDSVKIIVMDKWLSSAEFEYLIDASQVLLFPYIEASQSGTIPSARAKGKFIVCTNVGGLPEQVKGYPDSIVIMNPDLNAMTEALKTALIQLRSRDLSISTEPSSLKSTSDIVMDELSEVILAISNNEE